MVNVKAAEVGSKEIGCLALTIYWEARTGREAMIVTSAGPAGMVSSP